MKIVILGASGQIGSVIFNGLKRDHDVVGTSRSRSDKYLRFDPFSDDWSVLGTPDILINCVGQIDAQGKNGFDRIHAGLVKTILANRQRLGNPRIIQISALGASPDHPVDFLRTKGVADDLLLCQPDTAVIRPSIVCTHRTMIVKKMIMLSTLGRYSFGMLPVPAGFLRTRIQPIMPEDLLELVRKVCIDCNVKQVDAVGPVALTFHDIIGMLEQSTTRNLRMIEVPKAASDLVAGNILPAILPGVISAQQYQLLFHDNVGNVDACERLLDRMPMPPLDFFRNEFNTES